MGPFGPYCWLDIQHPNNWTYIWFVLIFTMNWVNIIYTVYSGLSAAGYFAIRRNEIEGIPDKVKEKDFLEKYIFIARVLPMVLLVCCLPFAINTIYIITSKELNKALFTVHLSMYSLIGFFNTLAYSYFYRSIFKKCKKKLRQQKTYTSNNSIANI
jgi:hypothetical protein